LTLTIAGARINKIKNNMCIIIYIVFVASYVTLAAAFISSVGGGFVGGLIGFGFSKLKTDGI
jgi:hypothetical protein